MDRGAGKSAGGGDASLDTAKALVDIGVTLTVARRTAEELQLHLSR
jgi:transcriptional regulator GlxA family with amidase domain